MDARGRYAPSPTGDLHLGNARTALVAWWRARSTGSSFVLRTEDLDRARSREEAVAGNLAELRWLGLDWDEGHDVGGPHAPYRQSQRQQLYHQALAALEASGTLFSCYLSRKDLRQMASAPHEPVPVYGPRQRALNAQLSTARKNLGKPPSLRFRAPPEPIAFRDLVAGEQMFETERDIGDLVVKRADGEWAYHLAVVVDDAAMGIEEVVRGDDLLPATGAQLLLYQALGLTPPQFAHIPLLLDESGTRLSKRRGSLTLSALRARGVPPERIVGLLAATLGMLEEPEEAPAAALTERFRLEHLSRDPAVLTREGLAWLG